MTLALAVDTTAAHGSIALATESGPLEEVSLHAPQGFSHILFANIESLLARHHVTLADIQLFAGASGPGSFTGVRVGLSAIKGLAEVTRRPVVAISSLDALADLSTAPLRCPVIDAQRGEVYASLLPHIPESVLPLAKLLTLLPDSPLEWITPDPALLGSTHHSIIHAPRAMAATIARIAIRRAAAGLAQDPVAIDANYVRRSDAEIFWRQA